MISVTSSAAQQIRIAAEDSGADGMSLRIAAHYDEAANEIQYGIGFDDARDDDECIETQGVSILVSPLSREAVANLTIDYVEIEPGDFRFIFLHPDDEMSPAPASSCGGCSCGSGGCGPRS